MMKDFILTDESEELMSALENVKNVIERNNTESLQLESDTMNKLLDMVDKAYFTYESMIIYKRALDHLINDVDWSEEDLELLKLHNGGRYWETLDEDLVGDVDDFHDKVWIMLDGFITEMDADFDITTLSEYVSTADMFYDLEDGLKERYGY